MYTLFSTLIIITCILLVLIIMIQNPKGGGLSATFGGGGASQMMGVQKTTDFLDKGTWFLAITLLLLTLLSNFAVDRNNNAQQETELQEQIDDANFIPPNEVPINNIPEQPSSQEPQ